MGLAAAAVPFLKKKLPQIANSFHSPASLCEKKTSKFPRNDYVFFHIYFLFFFSLLCEPITP
jgi:hypothetical protein